ncbi:3-oxo-tetronate kinase [Algisphaera agarilytica]|uniref:3-oxo-tetronate kinase n=1 Tax=Algisphaera agarilytica TaxID=1385975 RepID=A0A7X0H343_9BACT|nr:3-oxo-tetronate kinase [Algisphaera agarilytica]MBB6428314.1 uncharacterized protein YgbK (DUF1537 family) [Algisphaera agarilytica]
MAEDQPTSSEAAPLLGCIADDVTGATDLAINLVQGGMRVVQVLGIPTPTTLALTQSADAIVVALKTRSIPKQDAIDESLQSLAALQAIGVERFYFKYCSTFDSTPEGNIGPVAEALMDTLGVSQTVFCPAFPRAGRTVYRGHLYVGDKLLHESGMQNHPLNPMTDADLVRVLSAQTSRPLGLLGYEAVSAGSETATAALQTLDTNGVAHVITDACSDEHLATLAGSVASMPLVTGGSGLARFLPEVYRSEGRLAATPSEPELPNVSGRSLVIAGSCSTATQAQVKRASESMAVWSVDVPALMADAETELVRLLEWAKTQPETQPILVASTTSPDKVSQLQAEHGGAAVAATIEAFLGRAVCEMTELLGVRRLVVAGGETSGAVAKALDVKALRIGPEICPGVPWTLTLGQEPAMAIAFKSGNFGDEHFFTTALEMLP